MITLLAVPMIVRLWDPLLGAPDQSHQEQGCLCREPHPFTEVWDYGCMQIFQGPPHHTQKGVSFLQTPGSRRPGGKWQKSLETRKRITESSTLFSMCNRKV
jgi:hypothetical protein